MARYESNFARRLTPGTILLNIVALFIILSFLAPIIWIFASSLKTSSQAVSIPPVWFFKPQFEGYKELFLKENFLRYLLNSIEVSGITLVIAMVFGFPAAYALARYNIRRKEDIAFWMLSLFMLPPLAVMFPYVILFKTLRLMDTHLVLIIAHLTFVLPLAIWLLQRFIKEMPIEVEEAADLDGANVFQKMILVVLPYIRSGFVATALLCFIFSWNNFIFTLFLAPYRARTLPAAAMGLVSYVSLNWNKITGGISIILLPPILITLLAQRSFAKGMRGLAGLK